MKEIEFNLLDEAWIRVRLHDNSIQEVSLTDALLHAHEYVDLAGETQTQDAAMLRLLLSIPLTIFYRVDTEGQAAPLTTADEALLRWRSLWSQEHFPEKPVREYLEQWHERFWLFHPERPFWQVPEAAIGTKYEAAKLNGEISESDNKLRLFPMYAGLNKKCLSYPQAARWLLYINAYDDTSPKKKGKNLPAIGVGWMGKIGFIQAMGRNLFETIMLNMTMLKDGQALWGENIPCWESDIPRSGERTEIALPDNLSQFLTLQSRRLLLQRKNDQVTGLNILGGDFFKDENAFTEQMTIWSDNNAKKDAPISYVPQRHDAGRKLWREFPSIFSEGELSRTPGLIRWVELLQNRRLNIVNLKQLIYFKSIGMRYTKPLSSSACDYFSDSLDFHISLLEELGKPWRTRITEEIGKCEKAASYVGGLQNDLALAGGFSYSDKTKGTLEKQAEMMRGEFYFAIDDPFRRWLRSIDREEDDIDEKMLMWQKICRSIAINIGGRMVQESSSTAMLGHKIEVKGRSTELMTSAKAFVNFQSRIWSLYPKYEKEGE